MPALTGVKRIVRPIGLLTGSNFAIDGAASEADALDDNVVQPTSPEINRIRGLAGNGSLAVSMGNAGPLPAGQFISRIDLWVYLGVSNFNSATVRLHYTPWPAAGGLASRVFLGGWGENWYSASFETGTPFTSLDTAALAAMWLELQWAYSAGGDPPVFYAAYAEFTFAYKNAMRTVM